jgi:hypothetical protein
MGLPLIEQSNAAYIDAVKQVTKSYFYRSYCMRRTDKAAQAPTADKFEDWTHPAFVEQANSIFTLEHAELGNIPLELISVSDLRETPRQRVYSILFRGPLEMPFNQGTFPLKHETMGNASLFLVPVAREPDGMRYEAVFNQLVSAP